MSRELQTINQQNKLALWAGRISECRSSGQNVKVWCKENGICEQTYYRWQKRLFEMAQAQLNTPDRNRQLDRSCPTPVPLKSYTLSAGPTPSV